MILGRTSVTKNTSEVRGTGYSKGHSSTQVVLVLYRALSLCFASLHVRLTHESAARVLESLRCSKIRAATSTPGSKENLPSSWWVFDMRVEDSTSTRAGRSVESWLFRALLLTESEKNRSRRGTISKPDRAKGRGRPHSRGGFPPFSACRVGTCSHRPYSARRRGADVAG